jgi:hypothetical protein
MSSNTIIPKWIIGTGLLFIILILTIGYAGSLENANVHEKTITIKGIICPTGSLFGQVQDEIGNTYALPISSCNLSLLERTVTISYNHIHDPLALNNFDDFDTIVPDGWYFPRWTPFDLMFFRWDGGCYRDVITYPDVRMVLPGKEPYFHCEPGMFLPLIFSLGGLVVFYLSLREIGLITKEE